MTGQTYRGMERHGARPCDAYASKNVLHDSIQNSYCFRLSRLTQKIARRVRLWYRECLSVKWRESLGGFLFQSFKYYLFSAILL